LRERSATDGNGKLGLVSCDPDAQVLVVTNMWPEPERPVYGIFAQRQVESLRAKGLRCDVLYLRGYLSPMVYPTAAAFFALRSLLWRRRYRLVHVHAGETSLAARFYVGPPMIVSYCGDDVLGDPREDGSIPAASLVRSWVIRAVSRFFAATITKTQQMHDRLPAKTQRHNAVIPNGVDPRIFRPLDMSEARATLGWSMDERVVLFAGTRPDSPRKRRALAEAAVRVCESKLGERVRLHVVASTPPEQMPILMNASDCLLLTSSIEGSPNVVKEALMCNLPVVATPAGDVETLLQGVEPSFVCPPDSDALGGAVASCVRSGSRSNGRTVAAWLNADNVALRVLELYRDLGVRVGEADSGVRVAETAR
jgi:glycosyltransferase involved in cell wall biosynthesis